MRLYTDDNADQYYLVRDRSGRITKEYLQGNERWSDDKPRAEYANAVAHSDDDPRPCQRTQNAAYQRWHRRNSQRAKDELNAGLSECQVYLPTGESLTL